MKMGIKRLLWEWAVGKQAIWVRPEERLCELKRLHFANVKYYQGWVVQYLRIFAKCFRESFVWLRLAACDFQHLVRSFSIFLCLEAHERLLKVLRRRVQNWHCSCQQSDTQKDATSSSADKSITQ